MVDTVWIDRDPRLVVKTLNCFFTFVQLVENKRSRPAVSDLWLSEWGDHTAKLTIESEGHTATLTIGQGDHTAILTIGQEDHTATLTIGQGDHTVILTIEPGDHTATLTLRPRDHTATLTIWAGDHTAILTLRRRDQRMLAAWLLSVTRVRQLNIPLTMSDNW